VLSFLGFFLDDDGQFPHLVSEWMAKGTLFDYLKILKPGAETIQMAKGAAAGLSYLHREDIVHADLKSQNILISDLGQPLIADFGVSHIMAASMTMMCGTSAISHKGTTRWTAVELFAFTDELTIPTKKTDVWAFGMVLYELLARKLPYDHLKYDHHVINAITKGMLPKCPPLEMTTMGVEKLWSLCEECWKREPQARPTSDMLHRYIGRSDTSEIPR